MSVGGAVMLARRLRKRTQPMLVQIIGDPDRILTHDRIRSEARSRWPNALVGDPAGPREATRLREIKDKSQFL